MQTDSQSGADKIVWQLRIKPRWDFTTVHAGVCLIPIEFKGWLDGMANGGIEFPPFQPRACPAGLAANRCCQAT